MSITATCSAVTPIGPTWIEGTKLSEWQPGETHIWFASVAALRAQTHRFQALLSSTECARAAAFRRIEDQIRYTIARGVLRDILGHYLHQRPESVPIIVGAHGKPSLAGEGLTRPISFNLSHSEDAILIGLAMAGRIGVDIEYRRTFPDMDDIAARFFSVGECDQLRSLPPAARATAFFDCWTRKEAFVKALGIGLSYPLDAFQVSLLPGHAAELLHTPIAENKRWHLLSPAPTPDYAAAIAHDRPLDKICQWQYTEALADG